MNTKTPNPTFRAYRDGDHHWPSWQDAIFNEDRSHKCPTYVHRTPPCQSSCPSGEDVRGWLAITRGIETPPPGTTWQEYAFQRVTRANPFPAMMGRVCPAPCEQGCNRNAVDDFVGINAVEQFIGDHADSERYPLTGADTPLGGKRVAIIGAGPAGLTAACQLRRHGHASVVFEQHAEPGGMLRYGIPNYRTPRALLAREIERIVALGGIEIRTNTRVGNGGGGGDGGDGGGDGGSTTTVSITDLEREFDAILWTLGCHRGSVPPGFDAPNCVTGVQFLAAFNRGDLHSAARRVVCVGGGDTSIDVVSVARRIGNLGAAATPPEAVIGGSIDGYVAHDSATAALREGAEVTLTSLLPRASMTATEHEITDALREGVTLRCGVMPLAVVTDSSGRATALRLAECDLAANGTPTPTPGGAEFEVECDLIILAIGQGGDLTGLTELDNGNGLITADPHYRLPDRPGHFAAGDILRPHLLTTAIGQASIAAESIHAHLVAVDAAIAIASTTDADTANATNASTTDPATAATSTPSFRQEAGIQSRRKQPCPPPPNSHPRKPQNPSFTKTTPAAALAKRPKVDVHHFNLLDKLREHANQPATAAATPEVHNYEDRSRHEIIPAERLFLAHFPAIPRHTRATTGPDAAQVIGHFAERRSGLDAAAAQQEAERCMSCGMCFECNNCVVYCPQKAVFKVDKTEATLGRYVDTDYDRCIGCHICAEVCPSGYIDMGLGG